MVAQALIVVVLLALAFTLFVLLALQSHALPKTEHELKKK